MNFHNLARRISAAGAAVAAGSVMCAIPAQAISTDQLKFACSKEGFTRNPYDNRPADHEYPDACTFEPESEEYVNVFKQSPIVDNCFSSKGYIDQRIDESHTVATSWSAEESGGLDFFGIVTVNGGRNTTQRTSKTVTNASTIRVDAGRRAVIHLVVKTKVTKGRIRVNYPVKVDGHYVWYINGVTLEEPTDTTYVETKNVACGEKLPGEPT